MLICIDQSEARKFCVSTNQRPGNLALAVVFHEALSIFSRVDWDRGQFPWSDGFRGHRSRRCGVDVRRHGARGQHGRPRGLTRRGSWTPAHIVHGIGKVPIVEDPRGPGAGLWSIFHERGSLKLDVCPLSEGHTVGDASDKFRPENIFFMRAESGRRNLILHNWKMETDFQPVNH